MTSFSLSSSHLDSNLRFTVTKKESRENTVGKQLRIMFFIVKLFLCDFYETGLSRDHYGKNFII